MNLVPDIIRLLPEAVTNPLTFVAFVVAMVVLGLMWYRTRRLKILLAQLDSIPASGRADLIRAEMGVVLPKTITADQWIRSQKHRYVFAGFVVVCFLVLSVVGIAGWTAWQQHAEIDELQGRVATVQSELQEVRRQVGQLSFDPDTRTVQVDMTTAERDRLEELNGRLEELTQRLRDQAAVVTLAENDRQRLIRAEAAIQHNRGLIYLQSGDTERAAEAFSVSIDLLDPVAESDESPEVATEFAHSLLARGLVGEAQGQSEARRDLERAQRLYRQLPETESAAVAAGLAAVDHALRPLGTATPASLDDSAPDLPTPDSERAVTVFSSPVSAVVVKPITLDGFPQLSRIGLVAAGTSLSMSTPVEQVTDEPGSTMLVNAGVYDVLVQVPNGSLLKILRNVAVEDRQTVEIETNALVAAISVSAFTVEGMPPIERVAVVRDRALIHEVREPNVPMLVEPSTAYEVWYTPAGESPVLLEQDVEVAVGQIARIEANARVAAIAARAPDLPGLRLESIQVVSAGTVVTGPYTYIREASEFGVPLMLYADDSYDVLLKPVGGRPIRIAENVKPEPGQITWVGDAP